MRRIIVIAAALLTLGTESVAAATASSAGGSGAACVFDAPHAVIPVVPLVGHVGWGFELPTGNWEFGANEGPGSSDISKTWYETGSRATMLATFATGGPYDNSGFYTQYRCAAVTAFNASAAEQEVSREWHEQYDIAGQDCEAQDFNVLARYGVTNMPGDSDVALPNFWFYDLSSAGFGSIAGL